MNNRILGSLAAISLCTLAIPNVHAETTACDVEVTSAPVRIAKRALEQNEKGVVLLRVDVDATGRATNIVTLLSSGSSRLDASARRSVTNAWRFDVSSCQPNELPAQQLVTIEFAASAERLVHATDECFYSSRASAYGRQRTKSCRAIGSDADVLARTK